MRIRQSWWLLLSTMLCLLTRYSAEAQLPGSRRAAGVSAITPRVVTVHIPNAIDSLHTNDEVEQWVRKHAVWRKRNYFYPAFQLDTALIMYGADCQQYCAALHMKPWAKVDLDGNGRTDLLAFRVRKFSGHFSREAYIFYDYGPNGDIAIEYLQGRGGGPCEAVGITQLAGRPALLYAHHVTPPAQSNFLTPPVLQLDTLVHQFGDLIEYNRHPVAPRFNRLEVDFGVDCCASFSVTVHADTTAEYQVKYTSGERYYLYNLERGRFQSKLDGAQFEQLQRLFQYLRPERLASSYAVNWTDAGTVWLRAEYGNGQMLQLKDYGQQATWGLKRLYELLFQLRGTQRWYSIDHPYDVPIR